MAARSKPLTITACHLMVSHFCSTRFSKGVFMIKVLSLPLLGLLFSTASYAATNEYTMEEVAKHATKEDCWFVVNGNVHNVTAVIPKHKGGEKSIIKNCGKDATTPFETQGGRGKHSAKAHGYLEGTKIGVLKK
jgi:cytochrome b involved in lipid metabolism